MTHNYIQERINYYNKLYINPIFMNTKIHLKSYDKLKPKTSLIYCDPPYENTTGYGKNIFDNTKFWKIMREWSKNNIVFISEYNAPSDFICVSEQEKYSTLSGNSTRSIRVEKLFIYKKSPLTKFILENL
jgi:DNA adenine methylase